MRIIMKNRTRCLWLVLLGCWAICAGNEAQAQVEWFLLDDANRQELLSGGQEVAALPGDLVIRNRHLVAVFAQPTADRTLTPKTGPVGGCLIDYTTRPRENDRLGAYCPGGKDVAFRSWSLRDALGREQEMRPDGGQSSAIELQVQAESQPDQPQLLVTYRLEEDAPFLTIRQEYHHTGSAPLEWTPTDFIRSGSAREDFAKTPDGLQTFFWGEDRYWRQAYAWVPAKGKVNCCSDARTTRLTYLLESTTETADESYDESSGQLVLQPGETRTVELKLLVGENLCQLQALRGELTGVDRGAVALTVSTPAQFLPEARIEVHQGADYFGTLWTDGSGRVDQSFPVGSYELHISHWGQSVSKAFPLQVETGLNQVDIETRHQVGLLRLHIVDEQARPLPCKVQLLRPESAPPLVFGPVSAATGVQHVRYLADGREELLLPVGDYEAIVSRGPEYDALFQKFEVQPGGVVTVQKTLPRVLETSGWISAAFHGPTDSAGNAAPPSLGLVLNLVGEQVEFVLHAEHGRVDTLPSHIAALGLEKQLAAAAVMATEVHPLPKDLLQTLPVPTEPESDLPIPQDPPDVGWLFLEQHRHSRVSEQNDRTLPFIDALEVRPLTAILQFGPEHAESPQMRPSRVLRWLQLLNQGFRIPGVVNSVADDHFHGPGLYRNWIRSEATTPDQIDVRAAVQAVQRGEIVLSNGPFLTVQAFAPETPHLRFGPGAELPLRGEQAHVQISVQCPNWFDVDSVWLLLNGRASEELHFRRSTHPQLFREEGVMRFEHTVPIRLKEDAHLIVVAAGENSRLGPVLGPHADQPPVAISNPIFFDLQADGCQPNRDPLTPPASQPALPE